MASPSSASKPVLHVNTKIGHPRLAAVHFDTPLRPRASTRGSPVEDIGQSPPFLPRPDYEPGDTDSEDELWMRGRSSGGAVEVGSKLHPAVAFDLELRASEADHQASSTVRWRSPSIGADDAEPSLEEPRPPKRAHTNLFGILTSSATFNEIDLTRFGGHRDTLAMLTLRRVKHSKDLPIEVFSHIVQYLDFHTYKSVRLTCRCWSAAFTYVRPLQLPPVYALPAEILMDIYSYLSPTDMNAARHTCRKWMIASLEYRLLAQVLERAGMVGSAKADAVQNEKLGHPLGGEWRLSKRLATECSLAPGWTGNGFPIQGHLSPAVTTEWQAPTSANRAHNASSLGISGTVDFAQLRVLGHDQQSSLQFVVSTCGRFLLVLDKSIIYVYCIRDLSSATPRYHQGGRIDFLVGIACPRSVRAVSMDTSKDRYTIAALLEDRMGLIMDVPELSLMARRSGQSSPHSERDTYNVTQAWDLKSSPTATPTTSQRLDLPPSYTDIYHASPITQIPGYSQPSPIPIQFIPHVMYRNLCSKTAPPLSVTVCPYRRCVAFGSSLGIELHWQDVRTGQELSRWMELIGPAEYIHFLPLRAGDEQETAKKLRLTSSRAGPTYYHDPISLHEASNYEHCKFLCAVPLSDGKHLLYTDPSSGELCLGTGLHYTFGRPKPVKRFVFGGTVPTFEEKGNWPACYRAGTELRWGARIVAGFGDDIWLFCVPPDFLLDDLEQSSLLDETLYSKRDDGIMVIQGVKVGEIDALVELAIDASDGDLTIHAFSSSVPAQVYQVKRHPPQVIKERFIASDCRVLSNDLDGNENLVKKGYVPEAEGMPKDQRDNTELQATAYRRSDEHNLPIADSSAAEDEDEDEDGDMEMKDHAVGDWFHGGVESAEQDDEGYASEVERADGPVEWGWNDASGDHEEEEPDLSREGEWDVMEMVRLEVEVLC
ncbi:MAG: hypothetical protein Q9184_004733, partial [Pyrenodesmia sp. 2 TL-2023]